MRILFILGLGAVALMLSSSAGARNVRNHNPLNIEYDKKDEWQGLVGSDGRFCIFVDDAHGFRVGAYLINKYQKKYGLKTIRQIIHRWAPPEENDSDGYAEFVARSVGVNADKQLDFSKDDNLLGMVLVSMAKMEGDKSGECTLAEAISGVRLLA